MKNIGSNIARHHKTRYDFEVISQFIKPKSKVLDIGCADGELLDFLRREKEIYGRGLEISQIQVSKALAKGLSVIQSDAENDLSFYPDDSFDYAILSQTIQATKDPKRILKEMLRIAEYAIVSLPNFAHFRNRLHLLCKGTMPVNKNIPFEWYETPNIHFCSIKDFENFCARLHFSVKEKVFLTSSHRLFSGFFPNFFAEYGIFLISRDWFLGASQQEMVLTKSLIKAFGSVKPSPQTT